MTWIQTIPPDRATGDLRKAYDRVYALYPPEYANTVAALTNPDGTEDSVVASHSLLPEVLEHAFSTFGQLLSPDLPLTRRQHEMINLLVSSLNRCHY